MFPCLSREHPPAMQEYLFKEIALPIDRVVLVSKMFREVFGYRVELVEP